MRICSAEWQIIVASSVWYLNSETNPDPANYGDLIDLFAPADYAIVAVTGGGYVYTEFQVPSAAAAYVAGAAALVLQVSVTNS